MRLTKRYRALAILVLTLAGGLFVGPAQATHLAQKDAVFEVKCLYVKTAQIDPIVYPGQTNVGHLHDFTGNTAINENSTPSSLRAAGDGTTSCRLSTNESGYWMPAVLNDGVPSPPTESNTYYVLTPHDGGLQSFPSGLRMIAGNKDATSAAENPQAQWGCDDASRSDVVPPCNEPGQVFLVKTVKFPNCWNGVNGDSADHQSHMAYTARGLCPLSHPVKVPQLKVTFHYRNMVGGTYDPAKVTLSSGGQHSGHADFMNGWNNNRFADLIAHCLADTPHNCKEQTDANFPHGSTHTA